jgi:hypothetical protein
MVHGEDGSSVGGPVDRVARPVSDWVEHTCLIASVWRTSDRSILELFRSAEPDLTDRQVFIHAASDWFQSRAEVIEHWSGYSEDKRSSPSPYLKQDGRYGDRTAWEVGFFDATKGRLDVRQYTDPALACADFLYREAAWVLLRQRVT